MKIALNFTKKHLYFLIVLLVITTSFVLVRSYDPAQGWHSSSQIDWNQPLTSDIIFNDGQKVRLTQNIPPIYYIQAAAGKVKIAGWDGVSFYKTSGTSEAEIARIDAAGNLQVSGNVITGYEILENSGRGSSQVNCPSGKKAIGGGCDGDRYSIYTSVPLNDGSGWYCDGSELSLIKAYAICARIA